MPTETTLLTVILAAIVINLILAVGILVAARRSRGRRNDVPPLPGRSHRSSAVASSGLRPSVPVFGPPPHGQHATDQQTGLELAATWERWLVEEDARAKRYLRPATVVLVELDGLDRLVDRLGPVVAERLIPPVAATIRRQARGADRVARLGQARFGVILVETDEVQAINYVERVRAAADQWLEAGAVATRLSMGWAAAFGGTGLADAAIEAEARLNADRRRHAPAAVAADDAGGGSRIVEPALG